MPLVCHTEMHEHISHHSEKNTIFQMEGVLMMCLMLNNSFGITGILLGWTVVVLVVVSVISGVVWLRFPGGAKYCGFSSFLVSISTCFVVVRFDTGEGFLWEITVTPQSFVLSRCDDKKERGDTTNIVLVYGYIQFGWICL